MFSSSLQNIHSRSIRKMLLHHLEVAWARWSSVLQISTAIWSAISPQELVFLRKWTYNKQAWEEGTYRLLCLDVVSGVGGHDLSDLRGLFNDFFTGHFVEAVLRLEARKRKSQYKVNLLTFDFLSESSSIKGVLG
jgi:hypothetical protein